MRKVGNMIASILCVIFGVILLVNGTLIVESMIDEDNVPDVLGYFPLVVLSNSMYPTIEAGDMAIYQKKPVDDVAVGDVIVFYDPADISGQSLVTHRIIEVASEDGEVKFRTKGDGNNTEDPDLVPYENIVGVYKNRIAKAGNVALFMQTTKGMLICIVIPLCAIVLFDGIGKGRNDRARTPEAEN